MFDLMASDDCFATTYAFRHSWAKHVSSQNKVLRIDFAKIIYLKAYCNFQEVST